MKKVILLLMLSILLIPCYVKAEEVDNKEENIAETDESTTNEESNNKEDNTNDKENDTLNDENTTTENTDTNKENTNNDNTTDTSLIPNATAGVLMDATTGEIIFEKNKDEQVAVASMTKMVLRLLYWSKLKREKLNGMI